MPCICVYIRSDLQGVQSFTFNLICLRFRAKTLPQIKRKWRGCQIGTHSRQIGLMDDKNKARLLLATPLLCLAFFRCDSLSDVDVEVFYLNTIEQLFQFVEQLDQLEVRLTSGRLLNGIPMLAVSKI